MRTNFFVVLLCVVLAFSCAFAFSSCALSFTDNSAGNVETPIDPDEPTTDPDEPTTDPDEPEQPAAPTEGLEFMLLDNEMIAGLHEILGANLPDGYLLVGMENVTETDIVVPSTYNGLPVVGLFFLANKDITSVYIPDSVLLISPSDAGGGRFSEGCFENCTALTKIRLPQNPDAMIYGSAFDGCGYSNDASNWKNGALYIDGWLIDTSDELPAEYTIEAGTRGIAVGAFARSSVTKVTVPDSVTALNGAFAYCTTITEAILPQTLSYIGSAAFSDCTQLQTIIIPDSVTSIGYWAFVGCTSLQEIIIPAGVTRIGSPKKYDYAASGGGFDAENPPKSVIFKDPKGWYIDETSISEEELSDPAKAAEYIGYMLIKK